MTLETSGIRSGAAHFSPPAVAASYGRTAHRRAQLLTTAWDTIEGR